MWDFTNIVPVIFPYNKPWNIFKFSNFVYLSYLYSNNRSTGLDNILSRQMFMDNCIRITTIIAHCNDLLAATHTLSTNLRIHRSCPKSKYYRFDCFWNISYRCLGDSRVWDVVVATCDEDGAGTDASAYLKVYYESGHDSQIFLMDKPRRLARISQKLVLETISNKLLVIISVSCWSRVTLSI